MSQKNHHQGLSHQQVIESRAKFGENILTPPKRESLWSQFLDKFSDPIIIILLVALGLSFGVALYLFFSGLEGAHVFLEPAGIVLAVILATVVGFLFELSANRKFEILNRVNEESPVKVRRQGQICEISKKEVVVGDILILESGDEIPADALLLEAISLHVNESSLTGEPVAIKTINKSEFKSDATYPSSQILAATTIVDGHCMAEVTAVGDATEYGKVYEGSQIDSSVITPLKRELNGLADLITRISYGIAALIIIGRLGYYLHATEVIEWLELGRFILNTVMIAVTVIVVAVPEGLPMSVTLSLALSMKRMLSTNNLVRKMHACETMGATTVICTDKTGTLTQNQMRIYETNFFAHKEQQISNDTASSLIIESMAINSTAHLDSSSTERSKVIGNPTEGALLLWLEQNSIDYQELRDQNPIVEQLTFSTERKYMATIIDSKAIGKRVLYVKGAPEIVLDLSKEILTSEGKADKGEYQKAISEKLLEYQNQAMRTLGFAYHIIEDSSIEYIKDGKLTAKELTYLGVAAISDPIREDVPDAIKEAVSAGISVKIVTGDTPATAREIARQIGLWSEGDSDGNQITGPEFAALSDEQLLERIGELKIMSRARPMDKQRLVQLLQQRGEVVAVTGDGTNDAPALKAAQVGLSMGDGTSVAKEASDITILDNSFSSISRAVMWGRSLYQNIQRFILFQMTINVVACLIVLIGAFLGTESPLTVTQMLWVNLIMDTFAALALASLPPNESVMNQPPRASSDHIISRAMAKRIIGVGMFFVLLLFTLMQYFKHAEITSLMDFNFNDYIHNILNFTEVKDGLSPYELSLMFTIFVMLQFWNMFNAKAFMTDSSAFKNLGSCRGFITTALLILIGQWVIVTFGGAMFSVEPLKAVDWAISIGATSFVLLLGVRFKRG